jgi:hypothetical protein
MLNQVENLIYKNLTICPYCFWIKSFYLWLFNLWLFNFWVIASFQFLARSWIFGEIEPATAISNVVSNPIIDFD